MFCHLVPELRESILRYCWMDDLKNFSLTNKEHRHILQAHMFHAVRIYESDIEGYDDEITHENLLFTRILVVVPDLKYTSLCIYSTISKLNLLRELNLDYCTNMDSSCIDVLCERLLNLKVLRLSFTKISTP